MHYRPIGPNEVIALEAAAAATLDALVETVRCLDALEPAGPDLVPDRAGRAEVNRSEAEGRRHANAGFRTVEAVQRRLAATGPESGRRLKPSFATLRCRLGIQFLLLRRAATEVDRYLPATAALFDEAADALSALALALKVD